MLFFKGCTKDMNSKRIWKAKEPYWLAELDILAKAMPHIVNINSSWHWIWTLEGFTEVAETMRVSSFDNIKVFKWTDDLKYFSLMFAMSTYQYLFLQAGTKIFRQKQKRFYEFQQEMNMTNPFIKHNISHHF